MIRFKFIFFCIGAGLMACSSVNSISVAANQVAIDSSIPQNVAIDSIIQPYRTELAGEMNVVIATTEFDLIVDRPCGTLNNWVADALLASQIKHARLDAPVFCLLNRGGIRAPISKGKVTIGDIFKVMPFDNLVVWVKMPVSSIPDIESYIVASGGEPIAGAKLENGKLLIDSVTDQTKYIWIITSDYLVNGGDKMTFFSQKISADFTDVLMRNALISEAKEQQTLVCDTVCRISF